MRHDLKSDTLQKLGRATAVNGEAVSCPASDEAVRPQGETASAGQGLLQRAFARGYLQREWKRVKANKGAAGVGGLDIEQAGEHLLTEWTGIRAQLLSGLYRPRPVRRVMIPRLDASPRELDIPAVMDRLIRRPCCKYCSPYSTRPSARISTVSDWGAVRMMRYLPLTHMCTLVVGSW